jgi:hypothetical protein
MRQTSKCEIPNHDRSNDLEESSDNSGTGKSNASSVLGSSTSELGWLGVGTSASCSVVVGAGGSAVDNWVDWGSWGGRLDWSNWGAGRLDWGNWGAARDWVVVVVDSGAGWWDNCLDWGRGALDGAGGWVVGDAAGGCDGGGRGVCLGVCLGERDIGGLNWAWGWVGSDNPLGGVGWLLGAGAGGRDWVVVVLSSGGRGGHWLGGLVWGGAGLDGGAGAGDWVVVVLGSGAGGWDNCLGWGGARLDGRADDIIGWVVVFSGHGASGESEDGGVLHFEGEVVGWLVVWLVELKVY